MDIIVWLQNNWIEAVTLAATLIAVASSIIAVRVAVSALAVTRQSVQAADEAHAREVRIQAHSALAGVRGSFQKFSTECDLNLDMWRKHQFDRSPALGSMHFQISEDELRTETLRREGARLLRTTEERFRSIDQMEIKDLESAIPELLRTAASIQALTPRLQKPSNPLPRYAYQPF